MENESHTGDGDLTDAGPHRAQKQPGQDMRNPQDQLESDDRGNAEKLADVRSPTWRSDGPDNDDDDDQIKV